MVSQAVFVCLTYNLLQIHFFTLLEHMELTLSLEGQARRRALAKTRRLQQDTPDSARRGPAAP